MITIVTNPLQRRPKQDGRHTPNLWPVWLVAPGALLLVGATAFGLYHGAELLLSSETTGKKPVGVQDVIKTTVTVLTLIGAVLAALYAYRKQLLDKGTSHRADSTQLTERYTKAAEQLGHEQAAVRLAGVYAMARLADDWPEQRQVCVDVLCAYLRMPYETDTTAPAFRHGEREVRLTIIRTIRDNLQYRKPRSQAPAGPGRRLHASGKGPGGVRAGYHRAHPVRGARGAGRRAEGAHRGNPPRTRPARHLDQQHPQQA